MPACGDLPGDFGIAFCELIYVEVNIFGLRWYSRCSKLPSQPPQQRVECIMCCNDPALISLCIRNVVLRVPYNGNYLFQNGRRNLRPRLYLFLGYSFRPRFQLDVLLAGL